MKKENTSTVGLHLIPGASDGILTYADGIGDPEYQPLDTDKEPGAMQNDINKELRDRLQEETEWYEG